MHGYAGKIEQNRTARTGFTLIELMVVVVLIGILMGLLLSAVFSGTSAARNAQVVTEISNIETSLGVFQTSMGLIPPSTVILSETGQNWPSSSIGTIRRMFPQFNFNLQRDINGDGDRTDLLVLTSSECLVFFLGGVPMNGKPVGFSKNPANPLSRPQSSEASREGPFFVFDPGRLTDIDNDGMFEFRDPLPSQSLPYIYISANQGRGYNQNIEPGINSTIPLELLDPANPQGAPYMQTVYMQSANSAWNSKTFQIISPGGDATFGPGGLFAPDNAGQFSGPRLAEKDNITNFHQGMLSP